MSRTGDELKASLAAAIENLESNLRVTNGMAEEARSAAVSLFRLGGARSDIDHFYQVEAWCQSQSQAIRQLLESANKMKESLK